MRLCAWDESSLSIGRVKEYYTLYVSVLCRLAGEFCAEEGHDCLDQLERVSNKVVSFLNYGKCLCLFCHTSAGSLKSDEENFEKILVMFASIQDITYILSLHTVNSEKIALINFLSFLAFSLGRKNQNSQ